MNEKIWVPLFKAVLTGLLFALAGAALYSLSKGTTAWRLFWVVLTNVGLASWLAFVLPNPLASKPRLYTSSSKPKITRVAVVAKDPSGAYQKGTWADLPVSPEQMHQVADKYLSDGDFTMASMAGPGKPLSRAEFENLRSEFMCRGLAYWANEHSHFQGCKLTYAGIAVMKKLATPEGMHTHTGTQA